MHDIPRLTVVKFPASGRKDAYKNRSNREQREWTERILNEPDLEAKELGKLLSLTNIETRVPLQSFVFGKLLGEAKQGSLRWRLLFRLRQLLSGGRIPIPEQGGWIAWSQDFKGVVKPEK